MLFKFLHSVFILLAFSTVAYSQSHTPAVLDVNLANYEYPFPVKFLTISIQQQNYEMAYMDVSTAQPGKIVVLLHGKNFCGAYWKQTTEALLKEGFRVIIPDQIGFGKSSKPKNFQYTFQQLAINTKKLLDTLKIKKAIILGHSMGGMLATRFTLMFPESVEKLILENPIGLEDWKLKIPYKNVDWWYQNELKSNYESIKNYQLTNYYGGKWKPEFDEWVNLQAGWTKSPDFKTIAWNSALTYDMIFTQPVYYELEQLSSPTLLIIGQRDRTALGKNTVSDEIKKTLGNYPQLGKDAAKRIRNSKLVELDNIGHLPHIENFESFITPLLNFIK